jgi:hypothetical protein
VNVASGKVEVIYQSGDGANCGVVTCSPVEEKIVFIHGPEQPSPEWNYAAYRRRGEIIEVATGKRYTLDACDLTEPLTAGALRGGSHVHVFSGDGQWVSFTYEDHLLSAIEEEADGREVNLRSIGVSAPFGPVAVSRDHPRNHDGAFFSVLLTRAVARPQSGSDEISRAFEESWIGTDGYLRADGSRQVRALAFQGHVRTADGETISEVFVADLPDDLTRPSSCGPLQGTLTTRPRPPEGVVQRRITFTADRKHPGLQGPRHWLRSSPDGSLIAFLMRDDAGVVQLWTVSPLGGSPVQITANPWDIASAFSWSPDGRFIAHAMDRSVFVTEVATGSSYRLTEPAGSDEGPLPLACVFSPDGRCVAYLRMVAGDGNRHAQIFLAEMVEPEATK